ncbi:MAG: asparagine--tRNA ligase, partial [Clostridia bacterium]|nr:asparagine--tRNA ligase [Clostridia bacterium]
QIVIDKSKFDSAQISAVSPLGTSVEIDGTLVSSVVAQDSFEINAEKMVVLGECPNDYPLQKKYHSLEYLRTIPHLRVRTNTFNAMLRLRSKLAFAIHQFFQDRNFIYVNTPLITGSDCEGAGEIFRVTTLGYKEAREAKNEEEFVAKDFFGRKAGLTVSGQLEGEVAALAMGKIYTFGPTFRAENSNTARHAAEFWQIEPEVAFAKLPDIIQIAEAMIKYVIKYALDYCSDEISFFERAFEKGLRQKLENVAGSDFVVLDYTEAIKILEKAKVEFKYPVEWGCDLQTEHERYITEQVYNKPVFVTNYPKKIKSFYMKQNDDGLTVAATDLLVPGVGEIIGCSEREADIEKLVAAMNERNMNMEDYKGYLELRKYGSVPHSGFGLGFERILMYVSGISNIRDVVLYSRTTGDLME